MIDLDNYNEEYLGGPLSSNSRNQLQRWLEFGDLSPENGIGLLTFWKGQTWRMCFEFNRIRIQRYFASKEQAMAERQRLIELICGGGDFAADAASKSAAPPSWLTRITKKQKKEEHHG